MTDWFLVPGSLPDFLDPLARALSRVHGDPLVGSDHDPEGRIVIVSVADPIQGALAVQWLNDLSTDVETTVVALVDDGYLGTDVADRATATLGASAVSAVRSLAATRGTRVRANVVSMPESMFGFAGEQRGPLAHTPTVEDVVDAVLFLLAPESRYLSGQVLFVDGGRHLFSSHTS